MNFSRPQPPTPAQVNGEDSNDPNTSADSRSFSQTEDQPPSSTWKTKAGRIRSLFRPPRNAAAITTFPLSSSPSSSSSSSSSPPPPPPPPPSQNPLPPIPPSDNNSIHQSNNSRCRRYIHVWLVREPAKNSPSSSTSSSRGTKEAYRNAFKDKDVRKHVSVCVVSIILILGLIPLYLFYAANGTNINRQTYHIFFMFLIMVFLIIFIHSLARTCLLANRIAKYGAYPNYYNGSDGRNTSSFGRIPSVAGPLGYAQPAQPIHVVLARDEELAFDEEAEAQDRFPTDDDGRTSNTARNGATTKVTAPPPAYGLWRNSVRINPNLLYWQRVEAATNASSSSSSSSSSPHPSSLPPSSSSSSSSSSSPSSTSESESTANPTSNQTHQSSPAQPQPSASTQNRPPSYASEDGVQYVVEAQPRSTISAPQYYHHSKANS